MSIRIYIDDCGVATVHPDDIIFIHINTGFHFGEIGDTEYFCTCHLSCSYHTLSQFDIEFRHYA